MVLNDTSLSPQDDRRESRASQAELTQDLLAILHVFSSRLYGLRRYRRAIKEDKDLPQAADDEALESL